MKISITGRHMTVHAGVRSYAEEKAAKLERYFNELKTVEIILAVEGDRKLVEMIAIPRQGSKRMIGNAEHEDQFAAIDLVIDKMYKQLNKIKEKSHSRKGSERLPPPPDATDLIQDEKLETYQDAVNEFSEQLD
ncbi:ribosome-associated translation inhibitor RaiA [Planctomycetota bacterium]|nr:ribosome-associated translation inhibitor RaiA [Planctomycetota bacterium]